MRIALISEHASPLATLGGEDVGGQNTHVAELSAALAAQGHDVRVYTRRDDPAVPATVALPGGGSVVHVPAGPPAAMPKDALLPHMKERKFGHVVNVSSIGVQTNPPRFSAYVASKAALDAFTRVVSSETIGDNVTFTTIHMPLVRTPMIAPTKIYDSFPTISPDEAADLICEAIRAKPKQINTRLGTFGEVAYALAPKAVDQVLHMAYKVFPDSAAARGEKDPNEKASMEQVAMANLMKGVHW